MPEFGKRSVSNLSQCDKRLQKLFNEVIKKTDCAVICGYRGKEEQELAFNAGNSPLHYPNSKHNKIPALAADVVPWPLDWNNYDSFHDLANVVKETAEELGIKISWGGDWKKKDRPHYELVD